MMTTAEKPLHYHSYEPALSYCGRVEVFQMPNHWHGDPNITLYGILKDWCRQTFGEAPGWYRWDVVNEHRWILFRHSTDATHFMLQWNGKTARDIFDEYNSGNIEDNT